MANSCTKNILIGVTGSVASIKLPEITSYLKKHAALRGYSIEIRVVATQNGLAFLDDAYHQQPLADSTNNTPLSFPVFHDAMEWRTWKSKGDPILHIEFRRWADIFAIAPLDSNTLAKLAHGICDNLLTCIAKAWDLRRKPFLVKKRRGSHCHDGWLNVFPAMNTMMWEHPFTVQHLDILTTVLNIQVVNPVEKTLACGDSGIGALPPPEVVAEKILDALEQSTVRTVNSTL